MRHSKNRKSSGSRNKLPFWNRERSVVEILEKISTKELVEELKEREGVKTEYAEPHQDKKLSVNGPAVILIIID